MRLAAELTRRIQILLHRDQFRRELEEEIGLHLELRSQQQIERGSSPQQARRATHIKFGNTTRILEESLMAWGSETLQSFWGDIVYGTRALLRSPVLSLVALISLAFGIGANTAIFSLLDAVLLRSLPVKDPQQLVLLGKGDASGIGHSFVNTELYSYPFFRQLQQKNAVFSNIAAVFSMTGDVHGYILNNPGDSSTDSQLMHVSLVSGSYFPMLGVQAELGRTINEADDNSEGDHPVVVISYGFWKRAMGKDPRVLNRQLKLGATIFTIVGVASQEFFGTKVGESPDLWTPLSMIRQVPPGWDAYNKNFTQSLNILGRLKPGVSLSGATANVNLLFQQITRGFSDAELSQKNLDLLNKAHVQLTPMANGLSSVREQFSQPLQILMAVVAFVLLIACANIANLLLARSTARARELAVRQALGARRGRVIRQLLTESLLLSLLGGTLGIGLALLANRFLLRMVSDGFDPIPLDVTLNLRLLAFTFAVTVATAILFGTLPAFRATRLNLNATLRQGRGPSNAGARNLPARLLVVAQISLSLILMVGAELFLRSLMNLNRIDPGFNRDHVLRLQLETDATGYKDKDPRLNALFAEIESRVSALPGVQAASFSSFTFHEGSWSSAVLVPGMPNNDQVTVHQNVVGNGYFKTMQIPLVAGRTFSANDTATSQQVAVISERVAHTLFPPGNLIGRHFRLGQNKPEQDFEVIGIVKDVKFDSLREEPEDISYLSYTQRPWNFGDFEVRYTGDFNNVANAVQQVIHSVNHDLRVTHLTTLDEQVARSMTDQRLVAQLTTFFGILAVFLCAIGIYGLMSYMVTLRTSEIGLRMALGATLSNVRWVILRETLILAALGVAIGVPSAWAGDHLIANMLYGTQGTDAITLAAATLLLLLIASIAGYLPARRAAQVDPIIALRYE